ncbi:dUTPase [Bacillus methanolicus PB1]|uniref:dUTPase n=1 Tax=Bacillus methanolicus PB1 TaxID=997296 RepID=I3DY28_BACMT|nr:dUTP diphosphatase [Bacillus methanolicus]EIJ79149.1 dUTPase [Bacillus methanolicus PB1]
MNLSKLFELQRKLDDNIEKKHPRQPGEDRLAKKILALYSELGELLNEWREFKYWSYDQEPRTLVEYEVCKYCNGLGFLEGEIPSPCPVPNCVDGELTKNPLLEEFADCLHFILSIGLDIGFDPEDWEFEGEQYHDLTEQFIALNKAIIEFYEKPYEMHYVEIFDLFIGLGKMIGFTCEQIEEAYMKKNSENHRRQVNGY